MTRRDFTQYVHEFTDRNGDRRFAVARWEQDLGQYVRPLDATESRLTGCAAEFARKPAGVQHYPSRRQALRRARYLFYEMNKNDIDDCEELDRLYAEIVERVGYPVFHITRNGKDSLCGADGTAIHQAYRHRTLDRGVWCVACQTLWLSDEERR